MDYLCNCKSEIKSAMWWKVVHKIVRNYANGCFDRLISGQQSFNPWREAISILSGKYKRFTLVHLVRDN